MSGPEDIANLNLHIGTSSVQQANSHLDEFEKHARNASTASGDLGKATAGLSRQMDEMLRMQRETNALLQQSVAVQRNVGVEVEGNTRRMTQLAAGAAVAAGAYELFGRKAQEGSRQANEATQQVIASLDAVISRFKQLEAARFDVSRVLTNINVATSLTTSQGLAPAPLSAVEQNYQALQQFALRANTPVAALLQGAATGQALGIGDTAGAQLVQRMQQDLTGFSQAAVQARRVLGEFGITSRDPSTATRQFLAALNGVRDDRQRTSSFQSVFPGADPGVMTRTALAGVTPRPGT